MKKTLGLDLGTNSLGWAILDNITGDILDKGVVVFPEGTYTEDKPETPAATRRAARMGRRMKFRRKMRKWVLLDLLIKNGMCPMTSEELAAWKKSGKYPIENKDFIDWLKSTDIGNPYRDRAAAASGKVAPQVLGRALYHIAQRRGFKSSRKDEAAESEGAKQKDLGVVKGDIKALTEEIASAGCNTLGQYFAKLIDSERGKAQKTRVRKRHTGRVEHYMVEFSAIMDAQGIDGELRSKLYDAIFMQRPLRSQKHLVGNCPLEKKSPRVQVGHPAYEEFRMLALVNNLSFETQHGEKVALSAADRELVASAFIKASPTMKFKDISKLFKTKFKNEGLKFHHYSDDESVATSYTTAKIRNAFKTVPYDMQKVFDALMFFDDNEKLADWFKKHYPALADEQIASAVKIHPKEGNAQYSLKAISKMLPFLRKGLDLFFAKFLAKLPEVIEGFAEHEDEIVLHLKELQLKAQRSREDRNAKPLRATELFRDYLLTAWGVQDEEWNRLYLRDDSAYEIDPKKPTRIPEVQLGMIRNPLVQRSMTTLRRLVNYLRDHDKIDGETTIRIELARGVNDYATRHAIRDWQQTRENLRAKAAEEICKIGVAPTEDAIDRYVLWEEQGHQCLYTGECIALGDLFKGEKFDIEHTIPRSKSGDDSLANKTICSLKYNRQVKMGHVPSECPNRDEIYVRLNPWREKVAELDKVYQSKKHKAKGIQDPTAKAEARRGAIRLRLELDYWRDKLKRFEITEDRLIDPETGLSSFKRRQLVDTGIMSKHAVALLKSVYGNVFAVNGSATAFARKAWGIQGEGKKDRSEHTHHAKDAMVIAALTPARFTAICTALKDDGAMYSRRECDVCPSPYPNFAEKVRLAAEEILVKHVMRQTTLRQSSKRNVLAKAHASKSEPGKIVRAVLSRGDTVRGPLHKDTFYGCIENPETGKRVFVVRKPLVGALPVAEALVEKIVDPAIREIVDAAIANLKASGVKNIEPGMIKMPSGVPINKIRVFAQTTNPAELKPHPIPSGKDYKTPYYVTSAEGSNFRLGVFDIGGKLSVKPDNSLDWAQNHRRDDYCLLHEQEGFVGYITPGTMALTKQDGEKLESFTTRELEKRLYKVVKFENTGRVTFRRHSEARAAVVLGKDLVDAGKHKAGESSVDFKNPHELLYMSQGSYLKLMLFEGIHFRMSLDGTITFLR